MHYTITQVLIKEILIQGLICNAVKIITQQKWSDKSHIVT